MFSFLTLYFLNLLFFFGQGWSLSPYQCQYLNNNKKRQPTTKTSKKKPSKSAFEQNKRLHEPVLIWADVQMTSFQPPQSEGHLPDAIPWCAHITHGLLIKAAVLWPGRWAPTHLVRLMRVQSNGANGQAYRQQADRFPHKTYSWREEKHWQTVLVRHLL